jgi:hypothetical protein
MPALPYELPIELPGGGFAPLSGWESIPPTDLAWVESHCEDGKALLISQFRKPRIEALLCALLESVQEFEDANWGVLTERVLDNAIGIQLDKIGQIVNLSRGWPDETYRKLLRARVLVLRSRGRWPDLLGILDAMSVSLATTTIEEPSTAAFTIELGEPLLVDITAGNVFGFLVQAKPAGVRFSLLFPTVDLDMSFTFAAGDNALEPSDDQGFGDSIGTDIGGYLAGVLSSSEGA